MLVVRNITLAPQPEEPTPVRRTSKQNRLAYLRFMLRQKCGDTPITLDTYQRRVNIPFVAGEPVSVPDAAKPYLRELVTEFGYYSQAYIA
ncbi:hypothetical protein [Hymenobacter glacieicola]|uniref:Core-binding (CB) domain-containing protein n=1 Tax=Hymenobacter glacieicola TaxID=1562124 RepID=A0ABQ1X5U1_9BACT|nr:hypothetical protein [Hymenobacter glacieicola]GGG61346.1 hypothetical protein GCM10011378_41730 [Hymenobacter glacieicola]